MVGTRSLKIFAFLIAFPVSLLLYSCKAAEAELADIRLPPGFGIEVYADAPHARALALGDNGTVFVSTRRRSVVYAIYPGAAGERQVVELLHGLDTPNGIAFHEGDLYVAETARILRYDDIESQLADPPEPVELDVVMPDEKSHDDRYITIGPDGLLYASIGAPCNVCDREGFARIIRLDPDGGKPETFASGVRNSVGMTWHPETGELWFTDNGRDMLGDDLPPDELNHAPKQGLHFGYPFCHGGDIPDPEFGAQRNCSEFTKPVQKLGPHVASLGLRFYTGSAFPEEYHGQLFIAEHGSWNRSKKIGYRVSFVRLSEGKAVSYEPFAEGWLQGESVSGRPVDVLVLPDGSLLVSDDEAGKIYRIYYEEND